MPKFTYYWMLDYPEAERVDPHEEDVGRVWRDSGKIYGGRKIKHAPGHAGIVMSRRRVNRIMKAGGMAGSYSRARYRPHPARPNDDPAPNILGREFDCFASMFVRQVRQCFSVVWADGFPRCRHRFPVM